MWVDDVTLAATADGDGEISYGFNWSFMSVCRWVGV